MSSLLAEATAAAFPGCSEGCSRLRPEQGRDGRGRTALQWPVRRTARRAGVGVGPPLLREGLPLAAFEDVALPILRVS